jgi:aspartate racemase
LTEISSVPILNIIEETVCYLKKRNVTTFGLLATEGTVKSRSYHRLCNDLGMKCLTPSEADQKKISEIIYDAIKQNKPVDLSVFLEISNSLLEEGCECLVLGCTELSLLRQSGLDSSVFVDSLEVLAYRTILSCNKTPVGFPEEFACMQEEIV